MAITKEITIDIQNNIPETMQDLRALKKELRNTAAGSAEFKKLTNEIDDLEDKLKGAKKASIDWIDTLENSGGVLGIVGQQLNALKVSTQSWGAALKATGIGLVVSLLGLLAGAFSQNDNLMKKMQPLLDKIGHLFNGIFAAIEPLVDVFIQMATDALPYVIDGLKVITGVVAEAIKYFTTLAGVVKKLWTGDFKGAFNDAKGYVNDFGSAYKKTTEDFMKGSKELTDHEKEELEKRLEAQRKAEEERKKLAEEKAAAEKAERERRLEEERKLQEELRALNLALFQAEFADKEAKREQEAIDQENAKKGIQDLADFNANMDAEAAARAEEEANKQKMLDESVANAKVQLADTTLNIVSMLAKKGSAVSKAIALTEVARSTYKGIMVALSENYAVPAPYSTALKIISAAAVGVQGALQAKNILSEKPISGSGGVSGGGAAGGVGGAGGGAAAPSFNLVAGTGLNQIAQGLSSKDTPVKAFVVSKDVTTGQEMDRNIVKGASI